jgi:hypothetical protein
MNFELSTLTPERKLIKRKPHPQSPCDKIQMHALDYLITIQISQDGSRKFA